MQLWLHSSCNAIKRPFSRPLHVPELHRQRQPRAMTRRLAADMSGAASLAGTSALMFVGAYGASLLPMLLRPGSSTSHLRTINAAGAGLLLGAALCIVLPEGFVTYVEGQAAVGVSSRQPEYLMGLFVLLGFLTMLGLQAAADLWASGDATPGAAPAQPASAAAAAGAPTPPDSPADHSSGSHAGGGGRGAGDEEDAALLLARGPAGGSGPSPAVALEVEGKAPGPAPASAALSAVDQALYGLIVHAAADGIAVGAACLSHSLALSWSVGAAVVIHKFPVAFGLSSFLRGAGWQGARLQKGLLMFCSAAPLAALATFLVLGHVVALSDQRFVSLCLLYSGGTVLYAGLVHVLPSALGDESGHDHARGHTHGDGGGGGGGARKTRARERTTRVAVLVVSSFVPLLIAALVPEPE